MTRIHVLALSMAIVTAGGLYLLEHLRQGDMLELNEVDTKVVTDLERNGISLAPIAGQACPFDVHADGLVSITRRSPFHNFAITELELPEVPNADFLDQLLPCPELRVIRINGRAAKHEIEALSQIYPHWQFVIP